MEGWIAAALRPQSIAVVGASADPDKIGGRPIKYMLRHGYRGRLYPVNAQRAEVQGLPAVREVAALPRDVDLAVIALPGVAAAEAVAQCARQGVKVAVVISSGFGETGEEGARRQAEMLRAARAGGMRIVGPNTQGTVNFAEGAIASFATLIGEVPPADGPVAIVSQSGAMSMVPYAFLRAQGIGVRHSHATGNEADLTVADFTLAVAADPGVRLILLYLEALADPAGLERAAGLARERGIPIVALKAGVSERGRVAASSHTGALATEDRVVDAFFEKLGIWRVPDMRALCNAAPLYLRGWRPAGRRLVAISNSGASCVMAADAAERFGLEMTPLPGPTQQALREVMPGFAATGNPVDLTAMLLTNNGLFGAALPVLKDAGDAFFVSLPMSGQGYDSARFARDAAAFAADTGKPIAFAAPLAATRAAFAAADVPVFEHDVDAVAALGQLLNHAALLSRPPSAECVPAAAPELPARKGFLSEAESLALLRAHGAPVVEHRLCVSGEEAAAAFDALAGEAGAVAVKGCSPDVPHKTEAGLVRLNVRSRAEAAHLAASFLERMRKDGSRDPGVLVARMAAAPRELVIGARWQPGFGAVVMVGEGGKYVEALGEVRFLVAPFGEADVRARLETLRIAPLLRGARGEPATELAPFCRLAVAAGALVAAAAGRIASLDMNPVFAGPGSADTVVVDALVELD